MFELAVVDFAHACPVKVLAWEEGKVVREVTAHTPVAVVRQGELTQLFLLLFAFKRLLQWRDAIVELGSLAAPVPLHIIGKALV